MTPEKKKLFIKGGLIAAIILVIAIALLWYYQQQGLIKIFPSAYERQVKQMVQIDESKFARPEGLTDEMYQQRIVELQTAREKVLANPSDSVAWDDFAAIKEFLNDHEGAAQAWEQAHALQPNNFRTTYNLANTYQYFIKNYSKAEEYYLKTLQLQPEFTSAYDGLMDLYRYNLEGGKEKFEPLLLDAIEKDSKNRAFYYNSLAEFFASEETLNIVRAKEYYQQLQLIDSAQAQRLLEYYPHLR